MRTLPVLVMLLALVPFSYSYAEADDVTTLDLNEGPIDFLGDATTPDINKDATGHRDDATTGGNEGPIGYRDDITTPDIDEGATGASRSLNRRLNQKTWP